MTRPVRLGLFIGGMAALATTLVIAVGDLPGFGHYPGPYGTVIGHVGVAVRHGTDLITTVNFDYRVYDTLGEEFILFTAVLGVALVLRRRRGEERTPEEAGAEHRFSGSSSALGAIGLALVGPVLVLGAWVVTHGQLTPGGGFQGGVVLAAGILIVFLAGEYVAMKRVAPHAALELAEASGAAGLALVGLGGLVFAGVFFKNFISLGSPGAILSAGTIPIGNLAVGIEVAGAFLMLWTEFSDQALVVRSQ